MKPGKYVVKGRQAWLQYLEIPESIPPEWVRRDGFGKLHDHLGFSWVRRHEVENGFYAIEREWGTEEDLRKWEAHRRLIASQIDTSREGI